MEGIEGGAVERMESAAGAKVRIGASDGTHPLLPPPGHKAC